MKWPRNVLTIAEAKTIQERIRKKVRLVSFRGEPEYVAGVDAAFSDDRVFAAACLYRYADLKPVEQAYAGGALKFPYVPGYLSFREGPAIIAAVKNLHRKPDVLLVDGQGIAHPRGAGIASYLGVLLALPAIGCAKTRLIGEYREPGARKGRWSKLRSRGNILGAVLRTQDDVKPLFISPGHQMDLASAVRIVLSCIGNYRIPEPIRCADALSKQAKRLPHTPSLRGIRH